MIKPSTTIIDKGKKDLHNSTPIQPKGGFLTLIAQGLHFVLVLVLLIAARTPFFTKLKHLKTLFSIYLLVCARIVDARNSVLQALESVLTLASNVYENCCCMKKDILSALVGLWYRITQSLNLLEHVAACLRTSSEDQCRSRVESSLVVLSDPVEEVELPQPVSPTSSSASSFVSTPTSSPQSTPTNSRTNTYIKIVDDALDQDLSDSENETVGHLIVKEPTLVVVVAQPQTPSSASLNVENLLPSPIVISCATTSAFKSSNSTETVAQTPEPTLPVVPAPKVERVAASSVDQVSARIQKEGAQKKDAKVAKVSGKWVGKIKAMAKGKGKAAKTSVVV